MDLTNCALNPTSNRKKTRETIYCILCYVPPVSTILYTRFWSIVATTVLLPFWPITFLLLFLLTMTTMFALPRRDPRSSGETWMRGRICDTLRRRWSVLHKYLVHPESARVRPRAWTMHGNGDDDDDDDDEDGEECLTGELLGE